MKLPLIMMRLVLKILKHWAVLHILWSRNWQESEVIARKIQP